MGTEAVGSSNSSAAAQAWAAQAAAEAARRRAAEEAARKAAEEARRAAEAARKAAEEARRKADETRKAAEAAEAKAAKSKAKADAEDAEKLREKAKTEELAALKAEATANLRKKEELLANSKVDDAKQGRDAKAPSENTRAAQTEVDGAKQTVALYEAAPKDKKDTPLEQGSKKTQDLLDKAEKALDKVCDTKAKGEDPSKEDRDALDLAVNDWLESAQHDMRVAALSAQADGKDPQAAVKAQADKVSQSVKDGGMFIPEDLDKFIDSARDKVLGESGAVRQVRAEEYVVQKEGEKQLADTRKDLPKLDADADAAEAYAKRFNHASTDSQFDAMQAAQDDAVKKRAAATAAHQKVEGLSLAYEGSVDEKTGSSTPGSVEADYESRVADLDVKDKSAKLDQAKEGGDQKAIDAAGVAFDKAITNQTLAHSDRDVSAAKLEAADSLAERDAVQKTYDARKRDLPKDHDPALTLDYNNEADRKRVQLIDGKYYYVTHTPAKTTYTNGGKAGSIPHTEKAKDEKRELDPLTAQVWAANEKLDADKKTVDTAVATKTQAEKDLLSPDGKTAAKLDTTAWTSHEDDINNKLGQAKTDVATAQANLDKGLNTYGPVDVNALRVALGTAKKNQEVAQADVDALNAMRELRDAQRQEASGQVCMDPTAMETLRQKARTAVDKAANSGPELNPENEKKARDDLKDKLGDLKKQDDVVKTTQAAYDKAKGTDQEAAKLKERDDAVAKRGELDRTVRNYQTLLDKIDAERLALAAPDEYAKHKFVKPQLSMYMDGDHSATADFISRDYNPTWSITPDENGKVKADGLPRGIKPEDVEVKKEGNDWVVVFKKDSDVLGVVAEGKTHQQYRVHEGTVKMDAATARLWETNKKLADATKARSDFLAEVKDVGVPSGKTPQLGPDGKPLPTLSFADDLTTRRQQVASDIARTTRESRFEATPPAELGIARAELKAIDAAIAWQEADLARQNYDADVRAGTVSMCYATTPQETADDLRADAVKARSDWLSLKNNQNVDSARSDLKLKQDDYDKWKADHPYLAASAKESDSWKALQAAQGNLDLALRYQTAGANVQAQAVYEQYLADNLSPEKAKDPAALYGLFMNNPQAMAQSFINQHYIENGGLPLQMDGRVHLESEVALAFGWTPSIALDPQAPADSQELRRKVNIFSDLSDAQKKTLKATVDKIVDLGGDKAKITVLPVMYALPGDKGGIVKTAIFKVERGNEAAKFVDENGREYSDVRDFRANNLLPVENVNLAMPEDGNMSLDKNGNVKLFTGDARTETDWQKFRREKNVDIVVGAAGFVAGVVLTVGSFGTLSVPGALLMGASVTMLAASAYGVVTSVQSLEEQSSHGVDINPISNRQARMDWLNLGLSVAGVPVAGAGVRGSMLAWRAANAAKLAKTATGAEKMALQAKSMTFSERAAAWGRPGQILDKPLKYGGGLAFEEGVRYMADSWSEMTPAQRKQQIGMLGLNAMSFASRPVGRAYEQTHLFVKGQFNGGGVRPASATTNVTGLRNGTNGDGTTPVDGPDAEVIPIGRRTSGRNGQDDLPLNARNGDGSNDALHPFRDPAAYDESAVPDNVTPLHPRGVPEVPPEPVHAELAPVIELNSRGVFDVPDPTEPGSMPLAASNPRIEMLRLAAGGEEHADRTRVELPPVRPILRTVNAQVPANPQGNAGGGNTGGGTPGGSSNPANIPANPQGGQAIQMSANAPGNSGGGSSGGGNSGGGNTGGSTSGGSSNPANIPANPQGGQVVQASQQSGSQGQPSSQSQPASQGQPAGQGQPPASGQPQSPAQQAAAAAPGTPSQGGGNDPGKSAQPDAGQFAHLVSEPAPDSGTRFAVSGEDLSEHLFANGVGAKRRNTFASFEEARQAAAAKGGAQVHRIEPDETLPSLNSRGRAQPHEIVGAVKVNAAGEVDPVGVLNPHSAAASVPQVQPKGGHPYNSALTVNVGRPFEDIFLQGGIEAGADLAGDVLAQAIGDKGTANIMMATGYSSGRGKPETGGPGGAAVAGRSLRIRAQDEHGVALKVKYVVDRKHADVMTAALKALGEEEGTHFEVLTFNARGRWAKGRSQAFLDKHEPDLMMAFDVPGRTPEGRYVNANGKSVKWFNSARDQLFIDAKGRNIKTVSAFDLGNEVGGGNVHDNVRPAANGKPMASTVETDVAMTGGRTNWVGYAFAHEMLRRANVLEKAPTEQQIQKMVVDMLEAGAIDSVTGGRVAGEVNDQGHVTGVGGMSPTVEAALFNILKQRASQAGAAPNLKVDLRGIRLRLGVFDSGSGGIIAAADIRRVIQETTGAIVDLVIAGDHGAGTYGSADKTKGDVANLTLKGLQTLDALGCDLIVMACNTACTSGKLAYANGIKAEVIDLIESTRQFHKTLVDAGETVVAFSTEKTATLPHPDDSSIRVYEADHVYVRGGTDPGYNLAQMVNEYMPNKNVKAKRDGLQEAADHYVDKILEDFPDVTTISWCCTHYPELEPFFKIALDNRGRSDVKMVNPMEYQAGRAIEVARQLEPGTGAHTSRVIGLSTAVVDKQAALASGVPADKASVDAAEVIDTLRIALQRPDVELVTLPEFGKDVDVSGVLKKLNQPDVPDRVEALRAFDPTGRGSTIHVDGGATQAAQALHDGENILVLAGYPLLTETNAAGKPVFKADSDSIKGGVIMASGLLNAGKKPVIVTSTRDEPAFRAGLKSLGHADDEINIQTYDRRHGERARATARRIMRDNDIDTVVGVELPGRDAAGKYWDSRGVEITKGVASLDEFFIQASELNKNMSAGKQPIKTISVFDVGNEPGGGNMPNRVKLAANGQRISSSVTADILVTSGMGSWGADATVAALSRLSGNHALLPEPAQVVELMKAIKENGGHDSVTRANDGDAGGFNPTVHAGMVELFRQAARGNSSDDASRIAGVPPKGPKGTSPKATPPDGGKPGSTPAATPPADPAIHAAFNGKNWPSLWNRLRNGDVGKGTMYVYRVKGDPALYADPAAKASFSFDEIKGWGRVTNVQKRTVRWYGQTVPGEGVRGMLPHREMGAKFGTRRGPKEVVYTVENLRRGTVKTTTKKPKASVVADPNMVVTSKTQRGAKQALAQSDDTFFVVSNKSPKEVRKAGGLQDVPLGDKKFSLPSPAAEPKLPTGWKRPKILRRQAALLAVTIAGMTVANAVSPIQYGHDVPTGALDLPRNPIAMSTQHPHADNFDVAARPLSTDERIDLATAVDLQSRADKARMAPNADGNAVKAQQDQADNWWSKFSAASLKRVQEDAQHGVNAIESANALRAQLISQGKFSLRSDRAIQVSLQESGLVNGGEKDFMAQLEYAQLVAKDKAYVNDQAHRDLAMDDPVAFAGASLIEIGPMDGPFQAKVKQTATDVGRSYSAKVIRDSLADGDVATASLEARTRLDASSSASERAETAAQLVPLFKGERERAMGRLDNASTHEIGDYLAQFRDAPPEVAEPMAQAVLDRIGDKWPHNPTGLAGSGEYEPFLVGLSTLTQAADARQPTPVWSNKMAQKMFDAHITERQEFRLALTRSVKGAVEAGDSKLPIALANLFQNHEPAFLRDSVLGGIEAGLQAQKTHLGEALGNLRGTAGYNAAGSSMMFYLENFVDANPAALAQAAKDYRQVNPEVANRMDESLRVVGQWGKTLHDTRMDLIELNGNAPETTMSRRLDAAVTKIYGDDARNIKMDPDVEIAIQQSQPLKKALLARARQDVPDPRTVIEYAVNPAMFVTRHISGTIRMSWSLMADAQFNAMMADPVNHTTHWQAFKTKTERMAVSLGLAPEEVRQGTTLVDKYLKAVNDIDKTLPEAKQLQEITRLSTELSTKIEGVTGVGAKTINNVANAHTAFGQTLRWAANVGFVTHNISTEITNFRPLSSGVQDYAKWYHRIYAPTQAFFMLKPYTSVKQTAPMAASAIQAGKAADIESMLKWKYIFGAGTLGVGVADSALAFGQQGKVPNWVTFVNYGMGVSGIVDGGITLVNTTGTALARAGAVELGSMFAMAPEAATIGGLGVALFTGIKQFYNVRHHYDVVDAREAQRDPALKNMLLARGFDERQAQALLDCTHEGLSPMLAFNQMLKRHGMTVEQGLAWLQQRVTDDSLKNIPSWQDWTHQSHRLLDDHLNQEKFTLPGTDPSAKDAGTWHTETQAVEGMTYDMPVLTQVDSLDGLYSYLTRVYGPLQ